MAQSLVSPVLQERWGTLRRRLAWSILAPANCGRGVLRPVLPRHGGRCHRHDGPGQIGGLVGQQAYKRLKVGTDKLGDLVANTVSNWSHLLSASIKNLAAQGALQEAEKLGIVSRVRQAERGSVRAMFNGQERHYLVDDPLVMNALTALHHVGAKTPSPRRPAGSSRP